MTNTVYTFEYVVTLRVQCLVFFCIGMYCHKYGPSTSIHHPLGVHYLVFCCIVTKTTSIRPPYSNALPCILLYWTTSIVRSSVRQFRFVIPLRMHCVVLYCVLLDFVCDKSDTTHSLPSYSECSSQDHPLYFNHKTTQTLLNACIYN